MEVLFVSNTTVPTKIKEGIAFIINILAGTLLINTKDYTLFYENYISTRNSGHIQVRIILNFKL